MGKRANQKINLMNLRLCFTHCICSLIVQLLHVSASLSQAAVYCSEDRLFLEWFAITVATLI